MGGRRATEEFPPNRAVEWNRARVEPLRRMVATQQCGDVYSCGRVRRLSRNEIDKLREVARQSIAA